MMGYAKQKDNKYLLTSKYLMGVKNKIRCHVCGEQWYEHGLQSQTVLHSGSATCHPRHSGQLLKSSVWVSSSLKKEMMIELVHRIVNREQIVS